MRAAAAAGRHHNTDGLAAAYGGRDVTPTAVSFMEQAGLWTAGGWGYGQLLRAGRFAWHNAAGNTATPLIDVGGGSVGGKDDTGR